ncbi:DNA polymerase III subunit gamma/tau [Acetobacter sacchari]|uniref:DNA polymerase III subunit gamma/tau n=1 Tax=Acetobacter sacchari TaxID=2661687 RepID=A0ABS3LZB2_9PROT|nr:DNA polymerase III subunit gamma/tau [Acetobacter sacchari]MBO1361238.1 DNA polymerase III subunit gamma/tau [Acetobacter sacchari]
MSDTENEDDGLPLPMEGGAGLFGEPTPATPAIAVEPPAAASVVGASQRTASAEAPRSGVSYRVLARKYRPTTFDDLIGQEAMVRTLRNAFAVGRVAHAFMFNGVRGVGKTTTARIVARALNCVGPDGNGGPTADPCGVCPNCIAILGDRHPDVLEMDAASRTGVDDVREIIEATRFRPIQGRMKVFIIDEVHMLSRNAFNALLKTLEEPPSQVTFIFATTELRKVPVTVLSRCQRFDLRRVSHAALSEFFGTVATREGVRVEPEALALIARAADGSVRDGLSLLDQAIAQGAIYDGGADTPIPASLVSDMLGLADRGLVFDLFEAVMKGRIEAVLALADAAYSRGGDLGALLGDLAELTHMVTRLKTAPALRDSGELPEAERVRGAAFADSLSMGDLSRAWQILLKGLGEVETASLRREAAEMVLVRLCYAASAPLPGDLLKRLEAADGPAGQGAQPGGSSSGGGGSSGGAQAFGSVIAVGQQFDPASAPTALASSGAVERSVVRLVTSEGMLQPAEAVSAAAEPEVVERSAPRTWRELVAYVRDDATEAVLHGHLLHSAHLVNFAPPLVEFRVDHRGPRDLTQQVQKFLRSRLGSHWMVRRSEAEGEPTLEEQSARIIQFQRKDAKAHPLVRAILDAFPDAELGELKDSSLDEYYGLPPEDDIPDAGLLGGDQLEYPWEAGYSGDAADNWIDAVADAGLDMTLGEADDR